MLTEITDEGRKVIVFSQFTSMLDIIAEQLSQTAIRFVQLRGDTRDRATPVNEFQQGDASVFLISLKAGGTGLNLTAADTVIHYDPWWNPAVEDQATDRAHRIGQDKAVFVYKLIAQGTIEQRMVELQERKRALASGIIDAQAGGSAGFTEEDLALLLEPIA
jgi:SNF2 family DNA or RNA helicase